MPNQKRNFRRMIAVGVFIITALFSFSIKQASADITGTFTSQIKDLTVQADFETMDWTEDTIPEVTSVVVRAKTSSNSEMTGTPGWTECIPIAKGDDISGNNCVSDGKRYFQYQVTFSAIDTTDERPSLSDITVNYSHYHFSGSLISSPYDTSKTTNAPNKIAWTTESLPAGTEVKFQIRTSSDNNTWESWGGPFGDDSFFTDFAGIGEPMPANFITGVSDQWIQYKAYLYSEGGSAPILSSVNLEYIDNVKPTVSSVTADQRNEGGIIDITYSISDEESSALTVSFLADIGVTLFEDGGLTSVDIEGVTVSNISRLPSSGTIQIDEEQITYTGKSESVSTLTGITRGANNTRSVSHSNETKIWIKGVSVSGDEGTVAGIGTVPVSKSGMWNIKSDLDGIYHAAAKIKVSANDSNALNQVGHSDSAAFALDVKDPIPGAHPILIDATVEADNLTLSASDDCSADDFKMKISLLSDLSDITEWGSYGASSTISLAENPETVYVQFKDGKGNTSAICSAVTPETPSETAVHDASNAPEEEWKLFVIWQAVEGSFDSYEIYRSVDDGVSYTLLGSVNSRSTNYYTDSTVASGVAYYYKVAVKDSDGNQSYFSTAVSGSASGEDSSAPEITHNPLTQAAKTSSTATITFTTDEISDSLIEYSTDTNYGSSREVLTMITTGETHSVTLTGLNENTLYHYRIKSTDSSGNEGTSQDDENYVFTTGLDATGPVITFNPETDIINRTSVSATVTWTTNESATSRVDYGIDTDYGSYEIGAGHNTEHAVTLLNLDPGTTYHLKLTSVDNSVSENLTETGDYSFATLPFTGDSDPPEILSVSSGVPSHNSVTITWTTSENANSLVDFGEDTNYGITQGSSSSSVTSHSVILIGLAPGITYYYQVKSADAAGNLTIEDNSGLGYTFTTGSNPDSEDITAPTISSISHFSITPTTATVTWTTDEPADSVVGFGPSSSFGTEQGLGTMTANHSVTLINLAPETNYYYQIKSRDNSGNLATDNNSGDGYSFTTLAGGDEIPPIISDIAISDITSSGATVTWTTNENSNSLIDYSKNEGVFTSTTGKYQDNTPSHTVVLRGLDPSTAYYFQVRSVDASGNESKNFSSGEGYSFTTTGGGDETPPVISDVSHGDPAFNSVAVSWVTNELANSLVDFGTSVACGTVQGNSSSSVTSHNVILTGLSPGITYYYQIKSMDLAGNLTVDSGPEGEPYSFTTATGGSGDGQAPGITFDPEIGEGITNITSSSATISWTTDKDSDSTIGYSLDTSFSAEEGLAALASVHSITLTNLSPGTLYKFQIKSMDAAGNMGTESNGGDGYSFTTMAGGDSAAPIISNIAVAEYTDTTATITWSTDENSSSLIDYGTELNSFISTSGDYGESTAAHSVVLYGLSPETAYYYRVRSIDANSNQAVDAGGVNGYSFTTAEAIVAESECPTCPACGGGGGGSSCDTNPPTISEVKISEITANSATISWETNEKSYSIAEHGLSESYGSIVGLYNNSVKSHQVKIKDLEGNTAYHCRAVSADASGNLAQSEDIVFTTVDLSELSPEEREEMIEEQQKTAAEEIQTKIEEMLTQGMSEEEVRSIIAGAASPLSIATEGAIVENITNSSAKIMWITDRKSNSVVRFKVKEEGVDPESYSSLKQFGDFKELATEHYVVLSNLQSGTTYQYQAQSSDILGGTSKSGWGEFTTGVTPSIYDVLISEITLNSAVISWKTNVVSTSKVEYGETISYTGNVEDGDNSKVAKHLIKLNNLKSGTLYHFRVRGIDIESNGIVSDDYSFTTFTLPQIETYQIEEISEKVIKINWKTNVETDSAIKYTNLETNITKIQGEDGMSSIHNFNLKGLTPGTEYLLQIQGRDIYGNQAITSEFTAATLMDDTPPQITQVRTETAVSSGKSDVVQTIISWKTNEPATSQILWEEGISKDSAPKNSTKEDENYTTNHIVVVTTFKPSSVYRFRIQGKDKSGNLAQSQDFTILIPEKKKSVIQIIISNFEDTFGWVKKMGI